MLLDVDGILADFVTPTFDKVVEWGGPRYTVDDVQEWDLFQLLGPEYVDRVLALWRSPGYATALEPYPGAQDGVRRLREISDVFFVTAPVYGSPFWMWERLNWLKEHFDATDYEVLLVHSKYLVEGDVMVEDRPKNLRAWAEAHPDKLTVIWDQPYTRGMQDPPNSARTKSWDSLIELVGSVPL